MNITERELFENNKMTEALCQITFKQNLNSDFFDEFIKRIKEKYSNVEHIPLFHFHFNFPEQNPQKIDSTGRKISNEKKDKVVQVFTNNISIHQVGDYQRWEIFREDIFYILNEFQKLTTIEIGRIDLRTINVFDFSEGFNVSDYFNVALNYPSGFIPNSNFQFSLEQIYVPDKCAGVLRGHFLKERTDKLKFILDLSYVNWLFDNNVTSNDIEKIKESLEEGHLKLYNLFTQTITDKTRELIK